MTRKYCPNQSFHLTSGELCLPTFGDLQRRASAFLRFDSPLRARSGHTGFPEAAVATNVRRQVACPAQVGQMRTLGHPVH